MKMMNQTRAVVSAAAGMSNAQETLKEPMLAGLLKRCPDPDVGKNNNPASR